jgi:hypothetical protein
VLKWFKDKYQGFKAQRKLAKAIQPRKIKALALEIRDLAVLAAQLNPKGKDIQKLIRSVLTEMDKLSDLTDRPEFRKLSTGKKILLRQGLKDSREQLLETIESAPSPTSTLQ